MTSKRILLALAVSLLLAVTSIAVCAQSSDGGSDTTQQIQGAAGGGLLDAIEQAKQAQIKGFTGSWEGIETPGPGGPPPFHILITFGGDGTVVATDDGPPNPQLYGSEHGAWERTGNNEFLVIFKQLLLDEHGNLEAFFKARVLFKLNDAGTEINGKIIVDFYDPQGNKFLTGDGTIRCTKIKVEPLN
jgi:hypothetical protein